MLGGHVPQGLIDAIVAASEMVAEHPEVVEVDVNPLLVTPERAVALDCLIVLKGSESR
jgi:acetyltransferase